MAPTLRPIFYPTGVTVDPTEQLTKEPTTTPTEDPTSNPSLATAVPSVSPTRNMDPVIENPISTQYGTIDNIFEFYIPTNTFSDPDEDTLTLSVSLVNNDPLPSWINYVVASKKFIGTPTLNDEGTLLIKITAIDPQNASVSDIFGIVISEKETDRPTADPTGITLDPSYHPSTSPLAMPTTTSGIDTTTASPTKQPEQDSSSQGISSSSTKDSMFILVMCLGTGLFCFCGSVVFYCCFVNKKLEYSLQTMNKSVEEGKDMKSATQNVQNELQTLKTKEDTL